MKTISELIENQHLFESRGYSIVKVTKAGKEEFLKLPIKSTGVAEYQEKLSQKAPRPPVTFEMAKKGSKEALELGINHHVKICVFDRTDDAYIDELNTHVDEFNWRVVIFALDLSWKKSDGTTEATTFDEKKKVLQSNGITGHHIDKIFKDVQALTDYAEDRQDFLSESS